MGVKLSAASGGSIELIPQNTASNYTVTVPAATTTLVGADATQTLTNKSISASQLTGTIASARMPTGSIVQVVSATKTGAVASSSTSFVTTGLTASITPTSSANKILITISGGDFDTNGSGIQVAGTIYRGATNISIGTLGFTNAYGGSSRIIVPVSMQYLDSPATTLSTTYTLYFNVSSSTAYYNNQGGVGVITLMEIVG